ncbi:transglutaminase superfamily protein [Prauserella shujinwangii]|uniref:Transglutaminase superfamily protein n=1 Tax=Prauserella shujinwangii TaxID=1453103 RepID=A0A2T0M3Q3_9PSEU|nr:lasso peptide biosynthesis protein [Prauserella shujinwangii]PRX51373.1 transglutaminase superfamily protein [Prauserella shujinwangii]
MLTRTESRRELLGQLRHLMLGDTPVPPSMPVRGRELVAATAAYLRVGRAFRNGGLTTALPLIPPVNTDRPDRHRNTEAAVFCARDAAWRLLGLARTLGGQHLCLHESLGVCAGLRRVGFPADVVIGYPVIEIASGGEELHAWPALGSLPLVGRPGERPLGYVELHRYPEEEPW